MLQLCVYYEAVQKFLGMLDCIHGCRGVREGFHLYRSFDIFAAKEAVYRFFIL